MVIIHDSIQVFNPQGSDQLIDRKMWGGNPSRLIKINEIKYPFAYNYFQLMHANHWLPGEVDLTIDSNTIYDLTKDEYRSYEGTISYLTFLDSVQSINLPILGYQFTAPEMTLLLGKHTEQELLHNWSYQVLIDGVVPADRRNAVYELWREDPIILKRCQQIAQYYQNYGENKTPENYLVALFADYLLESILFISGFYFFYNLTSRGLMSGSCDMIKYVHRDENVHIRIFKEILLEAFKVFPYSQDQLLEIAATTVDREVEFCNHLFQDNILGITCRSTREFLEYLMDIRLKAINLPTLYHQKSSPYAHLDRIALIESKTNFFENRVINYQKAHTAIGGWDL